MRSVNNPYRRSFSLPVFVLFLLSAVYCSAPELNNISDRNSDEFFLLNFLTARTFQLSVSTLTIREGATAQYTISLARAPEGQVHIDINFDASQVAINGSSTSPARISFDVDNWTVPRTISVVPLDDAAIGGARSLTISHTLSGATDGLSAPPDLGLTINDNELRIFVTTNTTMGRIEVGGIAGIAGADLFCMQDPAYPGSGVYKAMLVDGVVRRACLTAGCVTNGAGENLDWVLQSNSAYHRPDGTLIASTGGGTPIFSGALTNSITAASMNVWTGFETVWTTSTFTCTGYTSSAGSPNRGIFGDSGQTATTFLQNSPEQGDAVGHVYCVEQ